MHADTTSFELPPMQYPMCGGHELRRISSDYTEKIVARNEILEDVVDQFLTTAITQREYTRSVAYVVVLVLNSFYKLNCYGTLGKQVSQTFCSGAISEFEGYDWTNPSDGSSDNESQMPWVDALALCALIGDLTSLRLIPYYRFKTLTRFLIGKVETRLHIECVHTLLSHAAARSTPEISPAFLYECIRTVKRRINHAIASKAIKIHKCPEEMANFETFVRQHLLNRTASEFPSFYDTSLNLEDALMASVCVGPRR